MLHRVAALVTFFTLATAASCRTRQTTPGPSPRAFACSARLDAPDERIEQQLRRDQPPASGVVATGRTVVTRTSPPYEIDLETMRATSLPLPGDAEVLDLAVQRGALWALAKDRVTGVRLFLRRASSWVERSVPDAGAFAAQATFVLAADADVLVALTDTRLSILEHGRWATRAVRAADASRGTIHALVDRRRLYVGRDSGEWGGDLRSIDLDRGEWIAEPMNPTDESSAPLPVRGLARDTQGVVWAARGLSHMGRDDGALYRRDPGGWSLVASVTGFRGVRGAETATCAGDWNLPLTSFGGLGFDAQGRVLLSTGSLGLVRRDALGWTRLTPRWPSFVYVAGLAVVGTRAAIGTFDSGVLVWDPNAAADPTRVPLTHAAPAPEEPAR